MSSAQLFCSMIDLQMKYLISIVFVICSSSGVSPDMVALMISGGYPYMISKIIMYFSRTMKVRIQAQTRNKLILWKL